MSIRVSATAICIAATSLLAARHLPGGDPNGRLYFLDLRGGRVVSSATDGSDLKVLVSGRTGIPDGIVVDIDGGHIYWTIMGKPSADDGMIERADLDGGHLTTIVAAGGTFTPKQLKLDSGHRKLYWSDREGMRIMRSNLDGTNIQTLVETGHGDEDRRDARHWCVGIALDVAGGKVYWTQKGGDNAGLGTIRRANLEIPAGETPSTRSDIELLFQRLPEPIDLDLDLTHRMIYWTDRGANIVSRAAMDPPAGTYRNARTDQEVLMSEFKEAIGIALDVPHDQMFVTDLRGTVYSAHLDGSGRHPILTGQGSLTGIAFTESLIPNR